MARLHGYAHTFARTQWRGIDGNGFWDLTAFTLQMAMVVLTGYVVATSPPVARLINRLALVPSTARTAVSFVAMLSMSVSS
ncbi:TIGR00366 family protein [Arthrobacter sp. Y81]|uniref:TIGR00366 family protein n=1 Tax=Arthrobacter sp. Y81 TaxID=2058897 RepID=UPI0021586249|nr:TIGR00366 family protein [Arthrobacter sp. Y81]